MANELLQTINRVLSGVEAERAAKANEALTLLQMKQRADEAEANRLYNYYMATEQQEQQNIQRLNDLLLNAAKIDADVSSAMDKLNYKTSDANSIVGILKGNKANAIEGLKREIEQNEADKQNIANTMRGVIDGMSKRYGELYKEEKGRADEQFKLDNSLKTQQIEESEARLGTYAPWEKRFEHDKKLAEIRIKTQLNNATNKAIKETKGNLMSDIQMHAKGVKEAQQDFASQLEGLPTDIPIPTKTDTFESVENAYYKSIANFLSAENLNADLESRELSKRVEAYKEANSTEATGSLIESEKMSSAKRLVDWLLINPEHINKIDYENIWGPRTEESQKRWLSDMLDILRKAKQAQRILGATEAQIKEDAESQIYSVDVQLPNYMIGE